MEFPIPVPYAETIGLELVRMGVGEAELSLNFRPDLANSYGVAHGGLLMGALDVAMALAARSLNPPPDYAPGAVTLEMKINFLRPGIGCMKVVGKISHRSASAAQCEGTVFDEKGQPCATATGSFKFMRALPVSPTSVQPFNAAPAS